MFPKTILATAACFFVIGILSSGFINGFTVISAQPKKELSLLVDGNFPYQPPQTAAYKRQLKHIEKAFLPCEKFANMALVTCVDAQLKDVARTHGARTGLDVAVDLSSRHPALLSYSHDLSHTVGLYALQYQYPLGKSGESGKSGSGFSALEISLMDRMGRALVDCYSWGVMGCMHGVIEAGVAKLPADRRTDVIRRACMENPLIQKNQVYINHCLHWAGHGMAIFTDQTLLESLAICEKLDQNFSAENVQLCISGVFHSGTFPRDFDGKYLDNLGRVYREGDVYYPCQDVPERFKRQCYNGLPGRARTSDLSMIFSACHAIPEADAEKKFWYVRACYDAAANILSMQVEAKPEVMVETCKAYADPRFLEYCYAGALRYWFLRDPRPTNRGPSEMCRLAQEKEKPLCYTALGSVIHESFYSEELLQSFCKDMADPIYYTDCRELKEF